MSEGKTTVFSVALVKGELKVEFNGKNVQHASDATSYKANGLQLLLPKQDELDEKGHKFLDFTAGRVQVRIFLSDAKKFASAQERADYAHLNVKFPNSIPTDAHGIFAELAGIKAMSSGTKALLKTPPATLALLARAPKMGAPHGSCVPDTRIQGVTSETDCSPTYKHSSPVTSRRQ